MSVQPESHPTSHAVSYAADAPETALKYAVQHIRGSRVEIVEGVIEGSWGGYRGPGITRPPRK